MNLTEDNIDKTVENLRKPLVDFVQQTVRTPSLPDEEHAVQELVANKLKTLETEVDVFPCQFEQLKDHPAFCDDGFSPHKRIDVVGRWRGNGSGRSLILNGHVDVVPTGDETLWDDSPWSGSENDGKIYGRGSCDMKGGVSTGIFAIEALKKLNFKPDGEILFESVVGEESGGVGTLAALERGYSADGAVILEPTSLCLSPIQSGALTFRLTVPGKATHAAMKWDGINAIEKFSMLQTAIKDLEKRRHEEQTHGFYEDPNQIAPINLGTIHGGEWHSTVPGEVVVEGRFGVFPGESIDDARKALEKAITEAALNDPWMKENPPVVEWFEGQFESGETAVDHPLIETLGNCHKLVTGNSTKIRGVTYGSDLRLFTNHGKMPAVLYGPGDVSLAHAANEYVEIEEVITATKVIALMIIQWCGGSFK